MTKNIKKKYEDLIDDLSRDEDERYLDYLKDRPETYVYRNLIFDLKHLDKYYKCEGCKQRKPKAFCCSGHDLELTEHDIETIGEVLPEVTERYPRLARLLEGKRFWEWGDSYEKMMRRKSSDDCIFLMPGAQGCYLHAWALEQGLDPLDVKPYVCSLYPMVIIIIGEEVVVTTVNDESESILEVGSHSTPCCTSTGPGENHTLLRSRDILVRMFGEKVYRSLFDHVFGKGK